LTVSYGEKELIDIDETVQLCLQRELHILNEQVSNLKAGLLTWLDHLQSVLILQEEFDVKYQQVRQTLEAIEKFIESSSEVKSGNTTKQLLEESVVSLFLLFLNPSANLIMQQNSLNS
jgi:hypothetical protein